MVDGRERLLVVLREFAAVQNELGRQFARSQGMHPTDAAAVVEVLTAEEQGRPLTSARLAARLGLSTGATSTLLNRLEEAGHVVRSREQRDRRVVTVRSTTGVHERAGVFYSDLADRLRDVLGVYAAADLDLVAGLVESLAAVTRDHFHPAGTAAEAAASVGEGG